MEYQMLSLYSKWTTEEVKKWKAVRSRGEKAYLYRKGVISFGGWLMLVISSALIISDPDIGLHNPQKLYSVLLFNAVVCGISGWIFGSITWKYTNLSYEKRLSQESV